MGVRRGLPIGRLYYWHWMTLRGEMLSKTVSRVLVFGLSFVLLVPPGVGQQDKDSQAGKDSAAANQPQSSSPSPKDSVATIAVHVNVVALPVTVRDKHGAIVKDLTKDDFTLQESGRPQTITYFSL